MHAQKAGVNELFFFFLPLNSLPLSQNTYKNWDWKKGMGFLVLFSSVK